MKVMKPFFVPLATFGFPGVRTRKAEPERVGSFVMVNLQSVSP
jgi:hypothetical protein